MPPSVGPGLDPGVVVVGVRPAGRVDLPGRGCPPSAAQRRAASTPRRSGRGPCARWPAANWSAHPTAGSWPFRDTSGSLRGWRRTSATLRRAAPAGRGTPGANRRGSRCSPARAARNAGTVRRKRCLPTAFPGGWPARCAHFPDKNRPGSRSCPPRAYRHKGTSWPRAPAASSVRRISRTDRPGEASSCLWRKSVSTRRMKPSLPAGEHADNTPVSISRPANSCVVFFIVK